MVHPIVQNHRQQQHGRFNTCSRSATMTSRFGRMIWATSLVMVVAVTVVYIYNALIVGSNGSQGLLMLSIEPLSHEESSSSSSSEDIEDENAKQQQQQHRVAGLDCTLYGGPYHPDAVEEMIYWHDIPNDVTMFQSPYTTTATATEEEEEELFLTFEPDEGGWNNIRMGMETVVALAVAMGRTLVLPPKMEFYLLWHDTNPEANRIGFEDFFHVDSIQAEHMPGAHHHHRRRGFKVITFTEFLQQQAMTGKLVDPVTGQPSFPPENRTDWNRVIDTNFEGKELWTWLRNVTKPLHWNFDECVVALPARPGREAATAMNQYLQQVLEQDQEKYGSQQHDAPKWLLRRNSYTGHPTPVNGSATDRLGELLASRQQLCIYDETFQQTKVVHGIGETRTGFRLLVHFYAFLFFENWQHDVWMKRFIRDHFRYIDRIQCAAARVIEQVRKRSREHDGGAGRYDSMHVRRGDFQYGDVWLSAEEMFWNNTHFVIPDRRTVYIATDEKNKTFFDTFREHYNVLFLDDFKDQLESISPNYYGMLDQLVASKGDVFVGAFFSTFTGYINRLRGYHTQKARSDGYRDGSINSYYYVPPSLEEFRNVMRTYGSVQQAFWQQEFPVAWRDIDFDVSAT